MVVKLYNKTGVADEAIRPVLAIAKRRARCKGDVVVKVTASEAPRGCCTHRGYPFHWHLRRTRRKNMNNPYFGTIKTDGGWIEMKLPCRRTSNRWGDDLSRTEWFFNAAIHEFVHVKRYQEGTWRRSPRTATGKRVRWALRPEEIQTQRATREALEMMTPGQRREAEEAILRLAVAVEAYRNEQFERQARAK